MSEEELKPCPWCNKPPRWQIVNCVYTLGCFEALCFVRPVVETTTMSDKAFTMEFLEEQWNTRRATEQSESEGESGEKTYYIGSYQRYCRRVRDVGLNTERHVFVSNVDNLRGLGSRIKVVDIGPPEIADKHRKILRCMGIEPVVI